MATPIGEKDGEMAPRLGLAVVHGRSMLPTLRAGDRLLVRYGVEPRAGALVIVRLREDVVAVKRAASRQPGGWWVASDNPREGVDSSSIGVIAPADVVAVVVRRVWPLLRRSPPAARAAGGAPCSGP